VNPTLALPLAVVLPLAAVAGVLLCRRRPNTRDAISVAAGVALAAVLVSLWPAAVDGARIELWTWLPNITLTLELEPLGLLFATVAGVLWPVTTVYSIGYMRANREHNQTRFYAFFALAIAAAQLIAMSGDLVTMFIGYEMLTLSTWPLVAHQGTAEARQGARTYLIILLTTSIGLLLPAIVWTAVLAGTTQFATGGVLVGQAGPAVLTLLYAMYLFGIGKVALMPFHRWLPAAMVAPTPVSALLHAVAVVKAGAFAVVKVTIYVFGLDTLAESGGADPMVWVAAVTLLVAGAIAVTRDDLKARLAYSTVSQLAYIALGAALVDPDAVLEGALHIATHAAGKITLFFCAGAIYTATGLTKVSQLDGLGARMPFTFAAFTIASLSIIGLPPLAGTWDKVLLMEGAVNGGWTVLAGVILVGSLLSIAYLLPVSIRAFLLPVRAAVGAVTDDPSGVPPPRVPVQEAPASCVVPLCLTALACVAMFFFEYELVEPLARVLEGR
jgi:multicomponent Na+:H+ antiporter subunit D